MGIKKVVILTAGVVALGLVDIALKVRSNKKNKSKTPRRTVKERLLDGFTDLDSAAASSKSKSSYSSSDSSSDSDSSPSSSGRDSD